MSEADRLWVLTENLTQYCDQRSATERRRFLWTIARVEVSGKLGYSIVIVDHSPPGPKYVKDATSTSLVSVLVHMSEWLDAEKADGTWVQQ